MGFAPAKDPKLLVYVAVKNPTLTPQETGTAPLTAVFNPVMKNSLQYLGVEPQKRMKTEKKRKKRKWIQKSRLNLTLMNQLIVP